MGETMASRRPQRPHTIVGRVGWARVVIAAALGFVAGAAVVYVGLSLYIFGALR